MERDGMSIVYSVALTGDEIEKLLLILDGAKQAALDIKEPELAYEITRLHAIFTEAVA
jgi:hypothetical protein